MDLSKWLYKGEFKLSSGFKKDTYLDLKEALEDFEFKKRLYDYLGSVGKGNYVGVSAFGAQVVRFIDGVLTRNTLYGLKNIPNQQFFPIYWYKKKPHGRQKQVYYERINRDFKTYIIDDVMTTGDTLERCMKSLREEISPVLVPDKIFVIKSFSHRTGLLYESRKGSAVVVPIIEIGDEL